MQPKQSVSRRAGESGMGFSRKVRRVSRFGMLMGVAMALIALPPFVVTAYADHASCIAGCDAAYNTEYNAAVAACNLADQQSYNVYSAEYDSATTAYNAAHAICLSSYNASVVTETEWVVGELLICAALPPPLDLACAAGVLLNDLIKMNEIENTYNTCEASAVANRNDRQTTALNLLHAEYANHLLTKNQAISAAATTRTNCKAACPPDGG